MSDPDPKTQCEGGGEIFLEGRKKYSTSDLLGVVMMYYLKLCFGLP